MACRAVLLQQVLPHLHTRTEDVELTLLLAERGARIVFAPEAVLYDPKPQDAARVSRQRARWLQGLAQVWADYLPLVLRLLPRGPGLWRLLAATLLKPKTAFVLLKTLLALAALLVPIPTAGRVAAAAPFLADVMYYSLGLWLIPPGDRGQYARAVLRAPLYLGVWARSAVTAWRERTSWLSARH
jgi:cellulose synthase/poly-beta-1,6-N-acetylglucosamine synthase-like glycosyltransferase